MSLGRKKPWWLGTNMDYPSLRYHLWFQAATGTLGTCLPWIRKDYYFLSPSLTVIHFYKYSKRDHNITSNEIKITK